MNCDKLEDLTNLMIEKVQVIAHLQWKIHVKRHPYVSSRVLRSKESLEIFEKKLEESLSKKMDSNY
jgi:hypothetical protein